MSEIGESNDYWVYMRRFVQRQILLTTLEVIMSALDDLKAQVAQTTSVEQSAVTLINGIASQIQAAVAAAQAGDAGALTHLKALQDALAAAVTANTPAAHE